VPSGLLCFFCFELGMNLLATLAAQVCRQIHAQIGQENTKGALVSLAFRRDREGPEYETMWQPRSSQVDTRWLRIMRGEEEPDEGPEPINWAEVSAHDVKRKVPLRIVAEPAAEAASVLRGNPPTQREEPAMAAPTTPPAHAPATPEEPTTNGVDIDWFQLAVLTGVGVLGFAACLLMIGICNALLGYNGNWFGLLISLIAMTIGGWYYTRSYHRKSFSEEIESLQHQNQIIGQELVQTIINLAAKDQEMESKLAEAKVRAATVAFVSLEKQAEANGLGIDDDAFEAFVREAEGEVQ
jgi:hypothetical protein